MIRRDQAVNQMVAPLTVDFKIAPCEPFLSKPAALKQILRRSILGLARRHDPVEVDRFKSMIDDGANGG